MEAPAAWGREDSLSTSAAPAQQTAISVKGRLPPEVVLRVVKQNLRTFGRCYDDALAHDPQLAGTLDVKFVIGKDGSVSGVARDARSTVSDPAVVACVTAAFAKLSFPAPETGVVDVVCPLTLGP